LLNNELAKVQVEKFLYIPIHFPQNKLFLLNFSLLFQREKATLTYEKHIREATIVAFTFPVGTLSMEVL
jgi:hypothetical protein